MKNKGYFDLTTEEGKKTIHFSMNCWYNLLEDTGKQMDEFGDELNKEFNKEKKDMLAILNLLTDLAFAAAKAHDQEQGNKIEYNRFQVRNWVGKLTEDDSQGFVEAMVANLPGSDGKK